MRGKSTYIILILLLIFFCVIMILLFGKNIFHNNKNELVLLVGNNTIWYSKDNKWSNITSKNDVDKLNWKDYHVYIDNKNFGNYYLWHDDKWYLFQEDKTAKLYDGDLFAYRYFGNNKKVSVKEFNESNTNNNSYINKVLKENGINSIKEDEYTIKYKTSLDYDNDSIDEDFYIISNAFSSNISSDSIFSIVFMVDNNKIYYVYNNVDSVRSFNGCKPFFRNFIDIDNDKTYEFILSCGRYSLDEQIDMLYKFKDDQFKILISNQ